jgi:hypothetical protein
MKQIIKFYVAAFVCLFFSGCALPLFGVGIAGAGKDSPQIRDSAYDYPTFQDAQVKVDTLQTTIDFSLKQTYSRDQYFANFPEHSHIALGQNTRMGNFEFMFISSTNELRMEIRDTKNLLVSETIPRSFYMGDLQVARFQIREKTYLTFAANSRTSTGRVWFAIFDETGKKYYAASLPQVATLVDTDLRGIILSQKNAASVRINLP